MKSDYIAIVEYCISYLCFINYVYFRTSTLVSGNYRILIIIKMNKLKVNHYI